MLRRQDLPGLLHHMLFTLKRVSANDLKTKLSPTENNIALLPYISGLPHTCKSAKIIYILEEESGQHQHPNSCKNKREGNLKHLPKKYVRLIIIIQSHNKLLCKCRLRSCQNIFRTYYYGYILKLSDLFIFNVQQPSIKKGLFHFFPFLCTFFFFYIIYIHFKPVNCKYRILILQSFCFM